MLNKYPPTKGALMPAVMSLASGPDKGKHSNTKVSNKYSKIEWMAVIYERFYKEKICFNRTSFLGSDSDNYSAYPIDLNVFSTIVL